MNINGVWSVDLDQNAVAYLPFGIRFVFDFSPVDFELDTVTVADFRLVDITLPPRFSIRKCSTRRALVAEGAAVFAEAYCAALGITQSYNANAVAA